MYSYSNFQDPALLTIRCECGRQFSQEEIYTCLGCCKYACRYCTAIQLHSYYCRNCSVVVHQNQSSKTTHCSTCFFCPTCTHVLSIYKDPTTKSSIYLCQFCYWTSKELGITAQTTEQLQNIMHKACKGLKQSELKYYQHCQKFLKEATLQNGEIKLDYHRQPRTAHGTRDMVLQFRSDYLGMHKEQTGSTLVANTVPLLDETIKFTTLDEEESDGDDNKLSKILPKPIPLIARKTRRCLHCKKLLTKSFRTFRGEHRVQLGHNQPRMLISQKTAVTDRVKIKALVDCIYKPNAQNTIILKNGEIFEILLDKFTNKYGINKAFQFVLQIQISIPNKQKKKVEYTFILQI